MTENKKKPQAEPAKDKNVFAGGSPTKGDAATKKAKQKQSGAHQPRDADVTSGHDVQKSSQEEDISEKPETGEKAADEPILYPVQIASPDYAVGNGSRQMLKPAVGMADKPV